MSRYLRKLLSTLLVILTLLAPYSKSLPVHAGTAVPPTHSPRLDPRTNWASNDLLPAQVRNVESDRALQPAVQSAAIPNYPDRAAWTRVVFQGVVDNNWEIFLNDGSDLFALTRLTTHPAGDYTPKLSPDTTKVVFASNRDGNMEIYRVNSDGTGLTRLTNDPAADGEPAWSSDGQKIIFVSERNGKPAL
jgi:hypothetical protein